MRKQLFFNTLMLVLFIFSCTGEIVKEKQLLKPFIPLSFGESRSFKKYGLSVEFKKMETDSFALFFLFSNDSIETDSIPTNRNAIILSNSLQTVEGASEFRLISKKDFTQLSIRSIKPQFDSIFHKAVQIIYNQSFDSTLITVDGVDLEDLQRYHSDKFVTTRMACFIIGNFELSYIENLIESSFYDRTVGTGFLKGFDFPLNDVYFNDTGFDSTEIDGLNSGNE